MRIRAARLAHAPGPLPQWVERALRPQALAGGRTAFAWTLVLAAAVALTLGVDLLTPNRFGAGALVVLPVLAASWTLGPRALVAVAGLAIGFEIVTVVVGPLTVPMLVGRVVTVTVVAVVGRAAARSFAEVRRARQREVGVLLRSSHLMSRSLDQGSLAAEAVRVAAGTLLTAGQRSVRRAVLVRFEGTGGTVLALHDDLGTCAPAGRHLDLAVLPASVRETLTTGRPNVVTAAELAPALPELAAETGAWALARVQVGGESFGILAAASADLHGFRRDDLRLLEGIARVTGLAIAAANQHTERVALEQRLQQSVQLALDVGRSLEPREVVDSILVRVTESVGAEHATLVRVEGDDLAIESTFSPDAGRRLVPVRRHFPAELVDGVPGLAKAFATATPVLGGRFEARTGGEVLVDELPDGPQTLTLPFVLAERTAYLLALSRETAFGDADVAQLGPMLDVAMLALRNAHRHALTRRAERAASTHSVRLELAIEAASDIGSGQELSDVVERVLRRAVEVVGAERGSISRVEDGMLVLEYDHRPPGSMAKPNQRRELARSRTAAEAIRTRQPVCASLADGTVGPDGMAWLGRAGIKHVLQCPLVADGEIVGILGMGRSSDERFTRADLDTLEPLITLAAVLVRNARRLAEARQVGEARSEVLSLAAHELRTPLGVIKGYLSLLEDGTYPVPERTRAEAVEILVKKAQELESLVESLLVATRLEGGTLSRSTVELDVRQAVREAVERARPRARLEGARIAVEAPDDGLVARADRGHVARILDNLLNNALSYSSNPATVTVELRPSDPVEVAVRDQGHGIPAAEHDRVFERFHRVDGAPSRSGAGLGLGLSISRELAHLNGGALVLEGSTPGRGSVFVLRLPSV